MQLNKDLGPGGSLDHRSPSHLQGEGRLDIRAAAHPELPIALGQASEDGCELDDTGEPSLADRRVDAAPLLGCGPNLQLCAIEFGFGVDDGRPDPISDIDKDGTLTGARRFLDRAMCMRVPM